MNLTPINLKFLLKTNFLNLPKSMKRKIWNAITTQLLITTKLLTIYNPSTKKTLGPNDHRGKFHQTFKKQIIPRGAWVAQLVKRLPSAQVMILESLDRVPHRAPCSAGSLPLPLTLPPLMCSLCLILSLSNK